jgi:hypothetical protein
MRTNNFNELSIQNKSLLVEDLATHLCSIEFYDYRIHLYALNSLFIEAYHNIESKEIERIESAEYGDLDKYLSRISLDYSGTKRPAV